MKIWMMLMKKYVIASIIAGLVIVTFATLPQIDSVQPDVLFYLKNLTPLYFVSVVSTAVVAIKYRRSVLGLFSVASLSLLVLWTPNVMMIQPWFLDSYPFTAEAVIVAQSGHLLNYHYLSVNPIIGLVMGPFLSVTGISPLMLQKLYTAFLSVALVVFIYLIAKAAKLRKETWIIAPLLFVSIAWPNEFHLSRQSFSLIFYVASWFLLLNLIFKKFDRRVFALLILQLLLVVMAHPATSLFLIANLAAVGIYGQLRHKFEERDLGIVAATFFILSIFWFSWNTLVTTEAITNLGNIGSNLISALLRNPQQITGLAKIFGGYSPTYGFFIIVRFVETLVIFASALLVLIVTFRRRTDGKILAILVGWTTVNVLSAVPLLYSGLSFFARPALFSFLSWAIVGALAFGLLVKNSGRLARAKKSLAYVFLLIFIIVPLVLIPVIKYSPMPIIYPSSEELAMKSFSDLHPAQNTSLVYLAYNLPYGISYMNYGVNETEGYAFWNIYVPGEGLNSVMAGTSALWVTRSLTMRDAFYDSTPSMTDVVGNLSLDSITHNKVYDGGKSQWILIPTFVNSAYFGSRNVTSLSCSASSGSITVGQNVSVSGALLAGSFGVSGRTLTIEYLMLGQADFIHTVTTNVSGGFSDSFAPNLAGNWTVRASFAGDAAYAGSSSALQFFTANW